VDRPADVVPISAIEFMAGAYDVQIVRDHSLCAFQGAHTLQAGTTGQAVDGLQRPFTLPGDARNSWSWGAIGTAEPTLVDSRHFRGRAPFGPQIETRAPYGSQDSVAV
jgi:hypothetical protein